MELKHLLPDFTQPAHVVILGAARSGLAAAHFLKQRGYTVEVSDSGPVSEAVQQELQQAGIPFEAGGHQQQTLQAADWMIASPGIPLTARPYQWAAEAQIPVISEIELACHFLNSRLIALTGSNGKSTTVSLITALLQQAGHKAVACGNIGSPMIAQLEAEPEFLVVEISSFQLETTFSLAPEIAVLLNLYENHLDRHGEMESYFAIKSRLFAQQTSGHHAVLNAENPWCQRLLNGQPEPLKAQTHAFGLHQRAGLAWVEQQQVYYQGQPLLELSELILPGQHNLENILAALTVAALLGLPQESVAQTLRTFSGMPHRLEWVAQWQGLTFINDSKSTNYLAAQMAIESFQTPLVLIAGGQDKGGDFNPLAEHICQGVKHTVLMGSSALAFQHRLQQKGYNQITVVPDMAAAVQAAVACAQAGDTILLSPATASYDAYHNFEERGEDFKQHVAALISEA